MSGLKIFFGNGHPKLGTSICGCLGETPGKVDIKRFADGEVRAQLLENIRGKDVFIIQPTGFPANENLMELLVMMDSVRRASAQRITAVLPYYGYGRQDRKDRPRVPITARLVADLLTVAGANRVLTMDLHAGQIQGFFNIPLDNLYASPVFLQYVQDELRFEEPIVVSPDAGGVERAKYLAKKLRADLAVADKRRPEPNVTESVRIIGDVKGKDALIVDDIIDTAGTLDLCVNALKNAGARRVHAFCSHGVFSRPSIQRINENTNLDSVVVTDSLNQRPDVQKSKKIITLSIAPLFAEAIKRIHQETSISSLFNG